MILNNELIRWKSKENRHFVFNSFFLFSECSIFGKQVTECTQESDLLKKVEIKKQFFEYFLLLLANRIFKHRKTSITSGSTFITR